MALAIHKAHIFRWTPLLLAVASLCCLSHLPMSHAAEEAEPDYGVDYSWPIHYRKIDPASQSLLHERQNIYDEYIQGCRDKYPKPKHMCDNSEDDRIKMSLHQPRSMQNYTDVGFKKIRTPEAVWKLLKEFWEKNKDSHKNNPENWAKGNSYANHWVSPTYMVSVENTKLRGGGSNLKNAIWGAAKDTLEEWTGEELTPCSLYGIRIYTEGAMLATHVDRLPLVSSAIVNVAQDVDEPWPIEVISHDGRAHNVTMEPGDMVLYESHSVLHGRPFALKGRYFANVFIHFEPTGHSLRHNAKLESEASGGDVHGRYKEALKKGQGGHENDNNGLPPYILVGSERESEWRREHPNGIGKKQAAFTTGSTPAHTAAQDGDVKTLLSLVDKKVSIVHSKDTNGWTPLHEGVRAGHLEVVKVLIEKGANVNEMTRSGETPLWWAINEHGEDHSIVKYLQSLDALEFGPEL